MKLGKLPTTPGVYLFRDKTDRIIYIGKAINLHNRVKSYFQKNLVSGKTRQMVKTVEKIDIVRTESEFEALLLEAKLIRKHQPRYNVISRDDKQPLYIKISREEFPKITTSRREDDRRSTYYGPFPSSSLVRSTLKSLRRIFPFCTHRELGKKACFYSHLGLCEPCPNTINSQSGPERERLTKIYRQNITNLKKVLSGRSRRLIVELNRQMRQAAKEQAFENAAALKAQITRLTYLITPRMATAAYLENPHLYEDIAAAGLKRLQTLLKPAFPKIRPLNRIEGYDISNLFGKEATGSLVVTENGLPNPAEYRRFKIRLKQTADDYSMLQEVLRRRFKNQDWPAADLLLIDGGKGQVSAAFAALPASQKNLPFIGLAKQHEIIVIPKIHHGQLTGFQNLKLAATDPALKLLQRLRDEAHRFAKKYHTLLRRQNMLY